MGLHSSSEDFYFCLSVLRSKDSIVQALIIAYARKQNVLQLIKRLQCLGVKQIYIALDGPKLPEIKLIQDSLVEAIGKLSLNLDVKIHLWRRKANLGVAASVITAIDWFFQFEKEGIILEDDLMFEDSFIKFCQIGLSTFRNNSRILFISGNQFNPTFKTSNCVIATPLPQTWGWATWAHRWEDFRQIYFKQPRDVYYFSLNRRFNFWAIGTARVLTGDIDTWDIPLGYFMWSRKVLAIQPPKNLVMNLGDDYFASHTKSLPSQSKQLESLDISTISFCIDLRTYVLLQTGKYLEKYIFGIKSKHVLLGFKYFTSLIVKTRNDSRSLQSRLTSTEVPRKYKVEGESKVMIY